MLSNLNAGRSTAASVGVSGPAVASCAVPNLAVAGLAITRMLAAGLVGALFCVPLGAQPGTKQSSTIPVRELSAPTVATPAFSNILNVRQIAGGQVLVNDAIRRQLILLDQSLSGARVILDSVTVSGGEGYGQTSSTLVPAPADSTWFVDRASSTLLVIDPGGKVTRSSAVPMQSQIIRALTASAGRVDWGGNLLVRAITGTPTKVIGDSASGTVTEESRQPDSTFIVRVNFDARKVDTIARLKQVGSMRSRRTRPANSRANSMSVLISPIETLDDWTTLSDGTVAVVRGGDYHVEFLRPNGAWESSAKLPFDWKPISDADKKHIVDSARAYIDSATAKAERIGGAFAAQNAQRDAIIGNLVTLPGAVPVPASPAPPPPPGAKASLVPYDFIPFSEMPSYYPPLRMGYTRGDEDGNIWILPTTSAQSKAGELVYDVVNSKGVLFERVRVPLGRAIAGFGAGGVVYLINRDSTGLWHLERSTVRR